MKSKFVTIGLLAISLAACSKEEAPAAGGSASAVPAAASAAAPSAAPKVEEAPTGPVTYKWAEAPAPGDIPDEALNGDANGRRWEAQSVVIEPGYKQGWEISFYEKKLENPTSFVSGSQFIKVNLPEEPKKGAKLKKEMKYGDGFFQIKNPDRDGLTSWNATNAYYIEFTEWDAKPYDEKGSMTQVAGTASGKVYVAYKGAGSFKNSGLWGTFKDAVVRYRGKPHWLKDKEKK
ncbi:MAG: hypothetical protein H6718_21945 [Polyangiaceae bacterium]|nr:hypothetical protein [Polyangiaceae bacterium]